MIFEYKELKDNLHVKVNRHPKGKIVYYPQAYCHNFTIDY